MPILHISMIDYDKEPSGFRIASPGQLSPLNVEQYDVGTPGSLGNNLVDAVRDVSLLTIRQASGSDVQIVDGVVYPANPEADRETKLLVAYTDDTFGRVHTLEIPGYNNVGLMANSDEVDLANAAIAALVTAIEAFPGPDGGTRTVVYARKVARNI